MQKSNRLTVIAIILMVVGIIVSCFTFYLVITNQAAFKAEVQKSLEQELEKYNLSTPKETPIDDNKLLLAVARYCEVRNNCTGRDGQPGVGVPGLNGNNGFNGYSPLKNLDYFDGEPGYTPVKGVDYFDGDPGAPGTNGREVERRCNPDRQRMEWRLSGDPNWQVEYKLAPGQSCEKE